MPDWLIGTFDKIADFITTIIKAVSVRDLLDIFLVALAIYGLIRLVRDSRAEQLLKGIIIFVVLFLISSKSLLDLKTVHYLMSVISDNFLIAILIIFQPELRRALEQVGHSSIKGLNIMNLTTSEQDVNLRWKRCIESISVATKIIRDDKMGALIVCERTTKLGEIVKSGTVINAEVTSELIANIFYDKAPLHDGAVIIRDGKIHAAGCILPLSDKSSGINTLGTRHRAALGISENSDAVAIVVSEETGIISIAIDGVIKRNYTSEALKLALENALILDGKKDENGEKIKSKKRIRKNGGKS